MSFVGSNILAGASGQGSTGYEIERSLRFNSADTSYLSKTFSSTTTTFTASFWLKRGKLPNTGYQHTFCSNGNSSCSFEMLNDFVYFYNQAHNATGVAVRDPSAWYHFILSVNSGTLTAYINGSQISTGLTGFSYGGYSTIGQWVEGGYNFDGYFADIYLIDGQALAPTDFGETDDNGVWQPKEFDGTYGPSVDRSQAWSSGWVSQATFNSGGSFDGSFSGNGQGGSNYLVWSPPSAVSYSDSLGGVEVYTSTNNAGYNNWAYKVNPTSTSYSASAPSDLSSFISPYEINSGVQSGWTKISTGDGSLTSIGMWNKYATESGIYMNGLKVNGKILVDAVNNSQTWSSGTTTGTWDSSYPLTQLFNGSLSDGTQAANSGPATLTFSSVTAQTSIEVYGFNTTTGTSEWQVTANGTDYVVALPGNPGGWVTVPATYPATLDQISNLVYRGRLSGVRVDGKLLVDSGVTLAGTGNGYHLDFADNSSQAALGTDTSGNGNTWDVNNITPASATIPAFTAYSASNWGDEAYLWDGSLSTYSYPNANTTSTLTFTPALTGSSIRIYVGSSLATTGFNINGSSLSGFSGGTTSQWRDITSHTGGTLSYIQCAYVPGQYSQYIYAIEIDGNILQSTAQTVVGDSLVDTPTNGTQPDTGAGGEVVGNYATWNPLAQTYSTLPAITDGNLTEGPNAGGTVLGTIAVSSGKWFWEITVDTTGGALVGAASINGALTTNQPGYFANSASYIRDGRVKNNGSDVGTYATYGAGDIIGVALDMDNGVIKFYKNNTLIVTISSNISGTWTPAVADYNGSGSVLNANFGQHAFAYTAPSGYKSLNTANLPEPTIADGSKYFDTKLYTGNGGTQAISGMNMSPDLVWMKTRSQANDHVLVDSVRGVGNRLFSNSTASESFQATSLTSFNSDGFTLGSHSSVNQNGVTNAAWAWDAGYSNTTIAAGSLNSSLYDQSQTWSGQVSGTAYSSTYAKTLVFDGSLAGLPCIPANGTQLTFTPSPSFSNATSVKIYYYYPSAHANAFVLNGTSVASSLSTGSSVQSHTFDVTGSGFTSLTWSRNLHASEDAGMFGIEVDGKLLVDSGVSVPNVPSIASTVRANPSAGFSIVSYTGNATVGATVSHQLNTAPELVIFKNRDDSGSWNVIAPQVLGAGYWMPLNDTSAASLYNATWTTTSSTIVLADGGGHNGNNDSIIAYCFAPVEGYSAMGSYTGNGSTTGPFVYTGFRPAFIMGKRTDGGSDNWFMNDSSRYGYNDQNIRLYPNLTNGEGASSDVNMDILSNGFRLISTNTNSNGSGATYIFVAFAEHPFKTARAR
jgi:hypothetical protein